MREILYPRETGGMELKMHRKFLVLFFGALFLISFEGKAIDYQCYSPSGAHVGTIHEKGGFDIADLCNAHFGEAACPKVSKGSTIRGCTSSPSKK